jgi:hypothetical protein
MFIWITAAFASQKSPNVFLAENNLRHVPHPPDTPDIAPSDFDLIGRIKNALAGCSFTEPDEPFQTIGDFLSTISEEELKSVFDGWIERVRWVIARDGENYQG